MVDRDVQPSMQEKLDSIIILWRQPDLLSLWGIPYRMRSDVGQQPYDLWKARRDWRPPPPGIIGGSKQISLDDWVWLGQPGWWCDMSAEDQKLVQAFLEKHKADIPQNPCEWVELGK